jgi:hypothetical protein
VGGCSAYRVSAKTANQPLGDTMRSVIVSIAVCVMHTSVFGQSPEPIPCVNGQCFSPAGATRYHGDKTVWYTMQSSPGYVYCVTEPMAYQPRQRRFALFNRKRLQYEPFKVEPLPVEIPQVAVDAAGGFGELTPKETLPEPTKAGAQPRLINDPDLYRGGMLTGVDISGLSQTPTYNRNGVKGTRNDVIEAMAANLTDLSHKRRITVIGNDSDMQNALNKLPKDVDDWAVVKTYPPDNWYVKQNGFQTRGTPVVYVQEPDGTVIHRQDNAENLTEAINAAKDYNPAKDADLRKLPSILGGNMFSFSFGGVLWFIVGCVAGAVAWPTVKAMWNTLNAANIAARAAAEADRKAQAEINRETLATLQALKNAQAATPTPAANRKAVLDS